MKCFVIRLLSLFLFLLITKNYAEAQSLQAADSLFFKSEWKAARENYLQFLADTSANSIAWNRLAYCSYNLGLNNDAINYFKKSLNNNPNPQLKMIAEERLAKVYAVLNNESESLEWLQKAQQSGFHNVTDIDTSKVFDNLRSNETFKNIYQQVYAAAYPCSANPRAKDFNFWIGEWDVYITGTRNLVGHSIIQSVSGGCGILENWTSLGGPGNGKSLNFYDTVSKCWKQVWVGSGGDMQTFVNGIYKDGMMHFTFEKIINDQKILGNFIFYNLGHGEVRQYNETSADGGKTYKVSYDLTYIRKKQGYKNLL